jgi:hypothetical protein
MLRHSSLFQFQRGDHVCVFYRTEEALSEVLIPFIADGLRRNERCFCAQRSHIARRLLFDLRFLGIDTEAALRRGALEIHTEDEVFLPNHRFEPRAMIDMLMRSVDDAVHHGFTGFRTAGELSWAARGLDNCDQLIDYEKMVDECFPGKPATGLCQYDMSAFAPDVLERVLAAHRLHISDCSGSSMHCRVAIRDGKYCTEIVADKLVINPSYYYVVQRRQPPEVIGWGIAPSFASAAEKTEELVRTAEYN